jgi:hypothetical protein
MPRIRTIKPDFWNDEKLAQEPETIMLTFIGTWNFSDDYGVVKGNPVLLKSFIYPYKDKLRIDTFSTWLKRLVELDAIIPFSYRGESFYYIRTFREHQKVEKPSKARNCPEDELTQILNKLGYILLGTGEVIKSDNILRTLPDYSPPYKEIVKEGDKDIGNGLEPIGSPGGKPPLQPPDPSKELKEAYKSVQKSTESIYRFIRDKKPEFIDPYIDFWNLFAAKNSLPKVTAVTEKRKKKFKKRIQEDAFNMIEVLRKAQQSDFLITSGKWFCFDWIVENESNYLKVIEGNYDNGKEIKAPEQTTSNAAKDSIYKAREKEKLNS